jgi:hypothetical protein
MKTLLSGIEEILCRGSALYGTDRPYTLIWSLWTGIHIWKMGWGHNVYLVFVD